MSKVYSTRIEVRFRDLDAMGHVNNAVFFTYFEEGRKGFFLEISGSANITAFPFILAHVSCDYVRPVKLDTELQLQMWVGEIGRKSFDLHYKLVSSSDESMVYAKGRSVQVAFDYKAGRSMEVSDKLRQILTGYQRLDS